MKKMHPKFTPYICKREKCILNGRQQVAGFVTGGTGAG